MLHPKSNQAAKLRLVPYFGDLAMLLQFGRSKIWRQFYQGEKKPYWAIFIWLINVKIEMMALPSRAILRYNHGRHSTGVITGVWTFTLMMAFNAEYGIAWLASFVPFVAPVLAFFLTPTEFVNHLTVDIRSPFLMGFLMVFTVAHLIHVIRIYAKIGNTDDHAKRGSSWLSLLLPKSSKLSEYYIQWLLEPLLVVALGYLAWVVREDMAFLAFMALSAFCMWLQETADGTYRYYHDK